MITWLFDNANEHGFVPNLVKNLTVVPGTQEWYDLCITPPFSYEFRFLKYCKLDKIPQDCKLVSDYIATTSSAYYPININFFDPNIDYISLMNPTSIARLKRGDFRILFYYSEGDNPNPDIYNSLDRMIEKHSLSPDRIRFVTANYKLRNKRSFVYFPDDEVYYRYLHLMQQDPLYAKTVNAERRDKKFTCLIRADKIWRKIYASFIHNLNITKDAYFSYTGYKYETSHCGVDDITDWVDFDDTLETDLLSFELHMPYRCDELSDLEHNNHKLINKDFYQNSYFNFVVETHFDNDTCFLTEKTFKPILNLQPFIIIGNPGSLALLKDLGYKTFEDVIKESYDLQTDHRSRMSELLKISYDISELDHKHHVRMQSLLTDTLYYNQRHFLAPKANRINKLLNQLEY